MSVAFITGWAESQASTTCPSTSTSPWLTTTAGLPGSARASTVTCSTKKQSSTTDTRPSGWVTSRTKAYRPPGPSGGTV